MSRRQDTGRPYAPIVTAAVLTRFLLIAVSVTQADSHAQSSADIRIRDPFILPDPVTEEYYLYANASNRTHGARSWECYVSEDLKRREEPVKVFSPPKGYRADRDFRAPEVFRSKRRGYGMP